jgi:TolB-like protein
VFLVDNGDEPLAKVLDFGVAKQSCGPPHTATGAVLGTIHYMAPEQLEGRAVDHRADLWSLTLLAAECLTGGRAVEGEFFGEVATRVAFGRLRTPSSIASVPVGFDDWFARGTRRRPEERFSSAEELAQSLALILGVTGTGAPSGAPSPSAGASPAAASPAAASPAAAPRVIGSPALEPASIAPAPTVALQVPTVAPLPPTVADGNPDGTLRSVRARRAGHTRSAAGDRGGAVPVAPRPSPDSFEALSRRPSGPAPSPRFRRSWALLGGAVTLAVAGWAVARRTPPAPREESALARLEPTAPTQPDVPALAADSPSVALLPFDVTGGSDAARSFADGVHADLLGRLGGVSDLRVASRDVVLGYRGSAADAAQIALELGVRQVVRTQLEPHGERATWRVRVQGADNREAWSRTYERALDDAVGLLSVLSSDLAAALSPRVSASERERLAAPASASSRAYELYLQAQRSGQTYEDQERLLREAVQLDPRFARAWLALAELLSSFYQWHIRRTPEQLEAASVTLGKAQALAPDDPEVRRAVAWSFGALYRDWPRAYREATALARDLPNSGPLQYMLSRAAERSSEPERAITHLLRAWELEPARDEYGWWVAYDQTELRRYDDARRTLQRVQTSYFYADAGRDFDLASLDFRQSGKTDDLWAWARALSPAARERPEERALLLNMAWQIGDRESYIERASDAPSALVDVTLRQIFLGIAWLDRGDKEAAQRSLDQAEHTLREELATQPDNARTHARLGLLWAVRGGQPELALDHAKRALRLVPQDVDGYAGPQLRAAYTCTLAWLGQREAAVRELQLALRRPYPEDHSFFFPLHVEHLKVGLEWKPLRGLPAFEALLAAPEARAAL